MYHLPSQNSSEPIFVDISLQPPNESPIPKPLSRQCARSTKPSLYGQAVAVLGTAETKQSLLIPVPTSPLSYETALAISWSLPLQLGRRVLVLVTIMNLHKLLKLVALEHAESGPRPAYLLINHFLIITSLATTYLKDKSMNTAGRMVARMQGSSSIGLCFQYYSHGCDSMLLSNYGFESCIHMYLREYTLVRAFRSP